MKNIQRKKLLNDSMIKKVIEVNSVECRDEFFNVSYGSDSEFLYGVGVSINSIIINNPDIKIHFHVFVDLLSESNINLFKSLIKQTHNKLTFYIIDTDEFRSLPLPSQAWNESIYYRLLIIHYLSKSIDTLLYLDADTVCNGSIDNLLTLEFNKDIFLYAVKDICQRNNVSVNGNNNSYFNSGFLYLSLELFMINDIPERAIYLASENDFTHPDQDALNQLLSGNVLLLSELYNYIFSLDNNISKKHSSRKIPDNVIFIHYVGITKPFFKWASYYEEFGFFEKSRKLSPWKNIPLLDAKTYKQLSRKKTHLRKNGCYIGFISTYVKYFLRFFLKNKER